MDLNISLKSASNHIQNFFQEELDKFQNALKKEQSKISLLLQTECRKSLSDESIFTPNYGIDFINKYNDFIMMQFYSSLASGAPLNKFLGIYPKVDILDKDEYIICIRGNGQIGEGKTTKCISKSGKIIWKHEKHSDHKKSFNFGKALYITNKLNIIYLNKEYPNNTYSRAEFKKENNNIVLNNNQIDLIMSMSGAYNNQSQYFTIFQKINIDDKKNIYNCDEKRKLFNEKLFRYETHFSDIFLPKLIENLSLSWKTDYLSINEAKRVKNEILNFEDEKQKYFDKIEEMKKYNIKEILDNNKKLKSDNEKLIKEMNRIRLLHKNRTIELKEESDKINKTKIDLEKKLERFNLEKDLYFRKIKEQENKMRIDKEKIQNAKIILTNSKNKLIKDKAEFDKIKEQFKQNVLIHTSQDPNDIDNILEGIDLEKAATKNYYFK